MLHGACLALRLCTVSASYVMYYPNGILDEVSKSYIILFLEVIGYSSAILVLRFCLKKRFRSHCPHSCRLVVYSSQKVSKRAVPNQNSPDRTFRLQACRGPENRYCPSFRPRLTTSGGDHHTSFGTYRYFQMYVFTIWS
jgi:hypothetical protein